MPVDVRPAQHAVGEILRLRLPYSVQGVQLNFFCGLPIWARNMVECTCNPKKGFMEGMKLTKMFCAFMSRFATATVMCGIVFAFDIQSVWGKPVDFELSFTHSGVTQAKRPLAHIFVLDRSGSMTYRDAEIEDGGTKRRVQRWEALKYGLRDTIRNTPNQTELRFLIVDGAKDSDGFLRFGCNWFGQGGKDFIIMGDEYRNPSAIESIVSGVRCTRQGIDSAI